MNQNKLPLLILIFSVIYVLTLVYFSQKINFLNQQLALINQPQPAVTTPPSTPTVLPTEAILPTSTSVPVKVTNIKYSKPSNWTDIQVANSSVFVAINPSTTTVSQNDSSGLYLRSSTTTFSLADTILSEIPYNNSSRYAFIYNIIGGNITQDRLSGYHEKEYKVNGKACLFLIGIQPSQSLPTWGMCPLSSTRALFINLLTMDDAQIEKTLSVIKF